MRNGKVEENMEPSSDTESIEPRQRRKSRRCKVIRWTTLCLAIGLIAMAYLPIQPFRPFCDPRLLGQKRVFLSDRLPDVYLKPLRYALKNTRTPFFPVGNRIFVPILSNGDLDDVSTSVLGRFFYVAWYLYFGRTVDSWRNLNWKVTYSAISVYIDTHPNSEIAKLYQAYDEAEWRGNPRHLSYEQRADLYCDIGRLITNPNLK